MCISRLPIWHALYTSTAISWASRRSVISALPSSFTGEQPYSLHLHAQQIRYGESDNNGGDNTGQAAGDNRNFGGENARNKPGLELAEHGATDDEHGVDRAHAPAKLVGADELHNEAA